MKHMEVYSLRYQMLSKQLRRHHDMQRSSNKEKLLPSIQMSMKPKSLKENLVSFLALRKANKVQMTEDRVLSSVISSLINTGAFL